YGGGCGAAGGGSGVGGEGGEKKGVGDVGSKPNVGGGRLRYGTRTVTSAGAMTRELFSSIWETQPHCGREPNVGLASPRSVMRASDLCAGTMGTRRRRRGRQRVCCSVRRKGVSVV